MSRTDNVHGRVAVVTGAGSGIGRALAQNFSGRGCPVVLADRDAASLEETAALMSTPTVSRVLDVSDRYEVLRLADEAVRWSQGPIGVVVNNAGITLSQTIEDASHEELRRVMDVNFWGVVHGTAAFLPLLRRQACGALVNMSSVFGLAAYPTQGIYCASKSAVKGFTESLRHELRGTGVAVHCVHPGGVATDILRNATFHVDDRGRTDRAAMEREFDRLARTSPAKAADVIVRGVLAGRPRILVGRDARMLDRLVRIAPARYYDVARRLEVAVGRDPQGGSRLRSN